LIVPRLLLLSKAESKQFFAAADEVRRIAAVCKAKILHPDEESDVITCGVAKRDTAMKVVYHVRLTNPSKLDRRVEKAVDGFIGVSEGTKRRWSLRALQRYRVISDGLDCDIFSPPADRRSAKSALGLPENRFIALYAGQIKEGKGVFDMIAAIALLHNDLSTEEMPLLLIAGTPLNGKIIPEIAAQTKLLGIEPAVQIIGQQEQIYRWMQAADALTLPSHEGVEGLPRVLFEGMACGAIGLGTDVSGVREAIPPGTGIVVREKSPREIADAILRLIREPEYAESLRQNGIASVRQRFDIRKSARSVEQFYEEILPEKSLLVH
jgi:glycosyltransferase involved in cell wall biosynthesis